MNFTRRRTDQLRSAALNDINYHYSIRNSLPLARNIINKSTRNARISRLSASYKPNVLLNLRINLLRKFYLHRVYP